MWFLHEKAERKSGVRHRWKLTDEQVNQQNSEAPFFQNRLIKIPSGADGKHLPDI